MKTLKEALSREKEDLLRSIIRSLDDSDVNDIENWLKNKNSGIQNSKELNIIFKEKNIPEEYYNTILNLLVDYGFEEFFFNNTLQGNYLFELKNKPGIQNIELDRIIDKKYKEQLETIINLNGKTKSGQIGRFEVFAALFCKDARMIHGGGAPGDLLLNNRTCEVKGRYGRASSNIQQDLSPVLNKLNLDNRYPFSLKGYNSSKNELEEISLAEFIDAFASQFDYDTRHIIKNLDYKIEDLFNDAISNYKKFIYFCGALQYIFYLYSGVQTDFLFYSVKQNELLYLQLSGNEIKDLILLYENVSFGEPGGEHNRGGGFTLNEIYK